MHAEKVRLRLTNEILLESGEITLLDELRARAITTVPIEELIKLDALQRILRIPFVLNVL